MPDRPLLEAAARHHGFPLLRIAEAAVPPDADRYRAFIAEGFHGSMSYLSTTADIRLDPRHFLAGARTVVVLAMPYAAKMPPDPGGLTGRVARYATGRDYHNLLLQRLKQLKKTLETAWPGTRIRTSVDLAPVYERAWARAAGLGWIGKNCCAILPGEGSYFFLATLMLDRSLQPDAPAAEHCGRCVRCLESCPTGAFLGPGQMDARRCISYRTIEDAGSIPEELRPMMGRWVFGCDDCQSVCPHTRERAGAEPDFQPRHAWLPLPAILWAPDQALMDAFEGTPIRRAAPEKLRRNACVVLGNIGDVRARPALEHACRTGSEGVREHAEWALGRLGRGGL